MLSLDCNGWGEAVPGEPGDRASWYAVHTSVHQERRVAERLEGRGIEFYLPLYRTVRRRSDRRVTLHLPLFPGYLFVRIALQEKLRVLEVPRVAGLVGFRRPAALPEEEIDRLRRGLTGQVVAEPCCYLAEGCRVRIVSGPFEGMTGVLLRRKHAARVVISVEVIARSFMVEVSETDLERM